MGIQPVSSYLQPAEGESMSAYSGRLVLVAHNARTIVDFRGPLVREMIARGLEVFALAPDYDEDTRVEVSALGAHPVDYSMSRATMNPLRDVRDFILLWRQMRRLKGDIVFSYTIKPVIYGTLAARLAGVPHRYAMIEGAGHLFTEDGLFSMKRGLARIITTIMYAAGLSQARRVFMLNRDDVSLFIKMGMAARRKIALIDGIGLDLNYYRLLPVVDAPVCFILVARLLREKGVYEYIEAARLVKCVCKTARFMLVGGLDRNPSSVSAGEIDSWKSEGLIEIPGRVSDVRPWLEKASVFVLPSYREGLPRSTQEAMAAGRPVITTDVPGCRDTVIDGVNGFIVPARDATALSAAMLKFVKEPSLVALMGAKSRAIAEERFDVHRINSKILREMDIHA